MKLFFKPNILVLLISGYLFTFISNYNFVYPNPSQILSISDIKACVYNGEIEIIDGSFQIYCFSSSNIEQDEYGNFINYEKIYEMKKGDKQYIDYSKQYMLIIGLGYISFNSKSYGKISINTKLSVSLPYELNHIFYKLNGAGNKLEVSTDSDEISVYISSNSNFCNSKCSLNVTGDEIINIVNLKNAKNKIVKLLYVQRNEVYNINENKGDKIQYIINQQFKFVISESLGIQYFNLKEGIIDIYGKVDATFENVENYEKKIINSDRYLYYIQPSSQLFSVILETNIQDEGEIIFFARIPTFTIDFPKNMYIDIIVTNSPQYVRFTIDKSFDENYSFSFQQNANWFEGKMFKENGELNYGENLSIINITKIDAGKTFTAVFNNTAHFKAQKIFDWIQINEYEIKYFSLKSGEEVTFKYIKNGISNVTFEKGYYGNNVEIFIYPNENSIKYDLASKNYSGFSEKYTSWKELKVGDEKKKYIYLIMQSKEAYSDYISFRTNYLVLNSDMPQTYENFYDLNFICYSLILEDGENIIDILTNGQDNKLTISLYQNGNPIITCTKKACHFRHIQNSGDKNYFIYIKNLENRVEKETKLYIFQCRINEYYSFGNIFFTKYFLSSFEYKFKLYDNFIPILNFTKELVINYQPPSNSEFYNITISSNIPNEFKLVTEKISNKIYRHYYYNLLNIDNISEIIFTIKGDISDDLFLPPEKVGLSFGGPFYYKCPEETVEKKTNSIAGNLIYFRIQNNYKENRYIISIPEKAKVMDGKLFKENGELNNIYIKMKRYITIKKLFSNRDIITIEYNGTEKTDAEIYYNYFNGEAIEIYDFRQFNYYELDFQKNKAIYFFGLYNDKIENAGAYIENYDKNIRTFYQDKFDLTPVIPPTDYRQLIDTEFFSLNREFDIIYFYSNQKKRDFIIYDLKKTEEKIYYLKNKKYVIPKDLKKNFNLITSEEEVSIYKMIIISKLNTAIDLYIKSNDYYQLNETNGYTKIFQIFKGEKFWFDAQTVNNSIIFVGIFEGSIFKRLILSNDTIINETANNILFQILSLKNVSDINIEIKNPNKTLFYWKLYKFDKNISNIENELQRLNLPILEQNRNKQKLDNIANIKLNNPFYNWNERFYNFYFSLSYEQDFENPIESNYEIKIKYNYRNPHLYIEKNNMTFLSNVLSNKIYSIKNEKKSYLNLILINYNNNTNENLLPIIYLQENKNLNLHNYRYFSGRFSVYAFSNIYANDDIDYEIYFQTKKYDDINNVCAFLYYYLSDEEINGDDLYHYNYDYYLTIQVNNTKISWPKLHNLIYYDIYIFNNETNFHNLTNLNNYCYLKTLNNKTNPDLQIIRTTNNFYVFEKKNQSLLITVIGLESNYNINIVYRYIYYSYEYIEEDQKSKTILLILGFSGGAAFIIIVILIYCCYCRKKSELKNCDYTIAMSDFTTLGIDKETPKIITEPGKNNALDNDFKVPYYGSVSPYN